MWNEGEVGGAGGHGSIKRVHENRKKERKRGNV